MRRIHGRKNTVVKKIKANRLSEEKFYHSKLNYMAHSGRRSSSNDGLPHVKDKAPKGNVYPLLPIKPFDYD